METTYTMRLSQLLNIALDLWKYMWQKLKPIKLNITTKVISEPNVAIMIQTHFEVDIITIEVDNQMTIIQVQVGKNIIEEEAASIAFVKLVHNLTCCSSFSTLCVIWFV